MRERTSRTDPHEVAEYKVGDTGEPSSGNLRGLYSRPCANASHLWARPFAVKAHFAGKHCELRWSMQHLLEVYSQESEIPGSFLDTDSSATRLDFIAELL
jgi:hypothetical protein